MPAIKYTPELCETIADMFVDGSTVTQVCARKLKIHRDTFYEWKKTHPDFKVAAEMGEQISQSFWEDIGKDGIVGNLDKFGGSSWQFVMKNRFKDNYADAKQEDGMSAVELLVKMLADKDAK